MSSELKSQPESDSFFSDSDFFEGEEDLSEDISILLNQQTSQVNYPANSKSGEFHNSNPKNSKRKHKSILNNDWLEDPLRSSSRMSSSYIPVLNAATIRSETFDLDYLLNPQVQKSALAGHRFSRSRGEDFERQSLSKIESSFDSRKKFKDPHALRLSEYSERKKKNVESMKTERQKAEAQECTFKPKILNSNRKKRSSEGFYRDMLAFKQKNLESSQQKKLEKDKELVSESLQFSYKPSLCGKSLQLLEGRSSVPAHIKLFRMHKEKKPEQPTQEVTPKQKPQRNVHELLYKDALKRAQTQTSSPNPKSQKLISENSEKYLLKTFLKELKEQLAAVDIYYSKEFNYAQFTDLLNKLFFVNETDEDRVLALNLWKEMGGKESNKLKTFVVKCFILAINNLYQVWTKKDSTVLSSEKSFKLHSEFMKLYQNRVAKLNQLSKTKDDSPEFKFAPQLKWSGQQLKRFEMLKEGRSIEDYLYYKNERINQKNALKKEYWEKISRKEETFQPRVNKLPQEYLGEKPNKKDSLSREYLEWLKSLEPKHKALVLYEFAEKERQKKCLVQKKGKASKAEEEYSVCTFSPQVNQVEYTEGVEIPMSQEAVERLKKAWFQKQLHQRLLEKGYTWRGDKFLKNIEIELQNNQAKKKQVNKQPLEERDEFREKHFRKWAQLMLDKVPKLNCRTRASEEEINKEESLEADSLLTLEVKGQKYQLEVKKDQNLREVVSGFASQHNLTEAQTNEVLEVLENS